MDLPFPIRQECPPGACDCERDPLLAAPQGDLRILRLTRDEEKRLIQRIEAAASLTDLRRLGGKMEELLGIVVRFAPGPNEVRTARGIVIDIQFRPGLCRKTRQSIPAAIRRCLDARPEIMFELLNEHDLLRDA